MNTQSPLALMLMFPIRLFATTIFAGYQSGTSGRSRLITDQARLYRSLAFALSVSFTASFSRASTSGFEYRLRLQQLTPSPGILAVVNRSFRKIGSWFPPTQ